LNLSDFLSHFHFLPPFDGHCEKFSDTFASSHEMADAWFCDEDEINVEDVVADAD